MLKRSTRRLPDYQLLLLINTAFACTTDPHFKCFPRDLFLLLSQMVNDGSDAGCLDVSSFVFTRSTRRCPDYKHLLLILLLYAPLIHILNAFQDTFWRMMGCITHPECQSGGDSKTFQLRKSLKRSHNLPPLALLCFSIHSMARFFTNDKEQTVTSHFLKWRKSVTVWNKLQFCI